VKHGVIGLLKHLAQSCAQSAIIHDALLRAEVVKHVSRSGVWDEKTDEMADIVQVSAIGVVKYMCNASGRWRFYAVALFLTIRFKWKTHLPWYFLRQEKIRHNPPEYP
jgi:hypothetical protein